ncbi:uncharacterized protein LY89DRAFT_671837 [Mollisia scopiformis]|uniref:Uncharacterized protein n=1 Tax=Mollisia scopiformis TaxID=149040 RepID=A0A194X399_MOLSC|nr:uncharacterized protein LY89DRAFT_671837 [Mollisia scopiformis]KUJ14499.1 hypothetical protein LY89DRAFT_671837 [Mollisia scopiformis]
MYFLLELFPASKNLLAQSSSRDSSSASKYKFRLPSTAKRKYLLRRPQNVVYINLKVDILWLTNADLQEFQLMLDKPAEARQHLSGSQLCRRIAVPWKCFDSIFKPIATVNAEHSSLLRSLCRARLQEVMLVLNEHQRSNRDKVVFSPACHRHPILGGVYSFGIFIHSLCKNVDQGLNNTNAEYRRLESPGKTELEILGGKVLETFERTRLQKCKEVQDLRDLGLRPDEFDKELEKKGLIGYEYWKVPAFRFVWACSTSCKEARL